MPGERIRLCPLGVDPRRFSSEAVPLPLALPNGVPVARYRVRFLNVSELSARKNLAGLLRAWLKATNATDDAVLVLKLGYHGDGVLKSFQAQLEAVQVELRKTLAEAAPVHFLYDIYSDTEMPRLYCTATHYCSMSFGEGWDQAAMEAAACGLRLVVPGHSAYTAYLDSSVASLIGSREIPARPPAHDDAAPLFENARWWQPDEDEAAACIRSAIDGRDGAKGTARSRVRASFTWEKATERLVEILSELDPPGRFWPFSARTRVDRS